jgi:hypothetical protein
MGKNFPVQTSHFSGLREKFPGVVAMKPPVLKYRAMLVARLVP